MDFFTYLTDECNYHSPREIGDNKYACLAPFIYTHAIIKGDMGDLFSYSDRWCYHSFYDAITALDNWQKSGYIDEPKGWHRHPASGRRIDEDGNEYINF